MRIKDIFFKRKKRDYYYGEYVLSLSEHHVLDKYIEKYPLYDRFLPLLCSGFKGLIIDVGANIGDTSISVFAQNNDAFLVGVEPDSLFFKECMYNIERNGLNERFLGINRFVSTQSGSFVVKKSDSLSTGSIEKATDETLESNTVSFVQLMDLIPTEKATPFNLLKIDTDGFDWDVLNSFCDYARHNANLPQFIFFEMQTFLNNKEKDEEGRDTLINNYKQSLVGLKQLGYTHFCLIDNFGTFVKKTISVDEIHELNQYVKRSQINNNHNTIYFFDVLAYMPSSEPYVDEVLNKMYT